MYGLAEHGCGHHPHLRKPRQTCSQTFKLHYIDHLSQVHVIRACTTALRSGLRPVARRLLRLRSVRSARTRPLHAPNRARVERGTRQTRSSNLRGQQLRRPVNNDIAGILRRMQPRCQRYRGGSLEERLVSELEGAPVHPDRLFAPNLLVDPHGVFRRDVLRESRWSEERCAHRQPRALMANASTYLRSHEPFRRIRADTDDGKVERIGAAKAPAEVCADRLEDWAEARVAAEP